MDTDRDCQTPAAFQDWPDAMERGRIPDAAFATAYARVPDRHRALIKTGLAGIHAACGGPMPLYRRRSAGLGHDLGLTFLDVPLDFVVVVCGRSFASPARLAAAVVPALCARVPEVAVVRVGDRWPMPLLVTLELCGVETVCKVGPRSLAALWTALPAKGQGAVVFLDDVSPPPAGLAPLRLLTARAAGRVGIFPGPDAVFDDEALALAHPDLAFFVHGPADAAASGSSRPARGTLADAAGAGYDAVYVGEDRLSEALGAAPLVLGPGRETFWLWPDLSPEAFRRRRVAAMIESRGASGFDDPAAV